MQRNLYSVQAVGPEMEKACSASLERVLEMNKVRVPLVEKRRH